MRITGLVLNPQIIAPHFLPLAQAPAKADSSLQVLTPYDIILARKGGIRMDMTKVILSAIVVVIGFVAWYLYTKHLFDRGYDEDEVRLHVFGDVPLRLLDRLRPGYKYRSEPKPYQENPPEYMEADSEEPHSDPLIAALMNASAVDMKHSNRIISQGGWRCACGRVNAAYISSCACGRNKHGELPTEPAPVVQNDAPEDTEVRNARAIREYKGLMDDGIITAEEFEAKKKQLLGI